MIVTGFPIPRRPETNTGLEAPLDMMAALTNARRVVNFSGLTFVKGFSAMLAAVRVVGNVVLWHLFFNPDRDYISYEDPRVPRLSQAQNCPSGITVGAIERGRHIVGWCDTIKNYAGQFTDAF